MCNVWGFTNPSPLVVYCINSSVCSTKFPRLWSLFWFALPCPTLPYALLQLGTDLPEEGEGGGNFYLIDQKENNLRNYPF